MNTHPGIHTSVYLLADKVLDSALVGSSHWLLSDGAAAIVEALGLIHGPLERVALPSEHVIRMGTIALGSLVAPDEGIRGT